MAGYFLLSSFNYFDADEEESEEIYSTKALSENIKQEQELRELQNREPLEMPERPETSRLPSIPVLEDNIIKSNNKDLFAIIRENDYIKLASILQNGANPNSRNKYNVTALMYAAMNNRIKCVEELLKNGASVNKDDNGVTALTLAVDSGYCKLSKLLLNNGANPNIKADNILGSEILEGITILEKAITSKFMEECSNEDMVKLLIESGADIEILGSLEMTPLMIVAMDNKLSIAEILINNGANIDAKNRITGATALAHAASSNNIELAKLLLDNGAKKDEKDVMGYTPLMTAEEMNNKEMIEFLSSHKRD